MRVARKRFVEFRCQPLDFSKSNPRFLLVGAKRRTLRPNQNFLVDRCDDVSGRIEIPGDVDVTRNCKIYQNSKFLRIPKIFQKNIFANFILSLTLTEISHEPVVSFIGAKQNSSKPLDRLLCYSLGSAL